VTARLAAVLGWPALHSKSPAIMNAAFAAVGLDAEMVAMGTPPEHFASTIDGLRALPMLGASVTVPHKLAALAVCDELSPAARAIGAVNCLELDGARLIGHNTDAPGFVDALHEIDFEPAGANIILLGAGGAARAVAYGAREAGANVEVVARSPCAWTTTRSWPELPEVLAGADLVVDCTPAGLDPATDVGLDVPLDTLAPGARVATLVYHRRTNLLERASERGHAVLDGRAMLVHQAAHAFAIWTQQPAPVAIMTRALAESLKIS
jgi:shikimate dehydrogenase